MEKLSNHKISFLDKLFYYYYCHVFIKMKLHEVAKLICPVKN